MSSGERIVFVVGWLLILLGLAGGIIMLGTKVDGYTDSSWGGILLAMTLFGGLPILAGGLLCRRVRKTSGARNQRTTEKAILRLALEKGRKIQASDIAASETLTLSMEEAEKGLKELAAKGICQVGVSDTGSMVYRFPDPDDEGDAIWLD